MNHSSPLVLESHLRLNDFNEIPSILSPSNCLYLLNIYFPGIWQLFFVPADLTLMALSRLIHSGLISRHAVLLNKHSCWQFSDCSWAANCSVRSPFLGKSIVCPLQNHWVTSPVNYFQYRFQIPLILEALFYLDFLMTFCRQLTVMTHDKDVIYHAWHFCTCSSKLHMLGIDHNCFQNISHGHSCSYHFDPHSAAYRIVFSSEWKFNLFVFSHFLLRSVQTMSLAFSKSIIWSKIFSLAVL